MLLDKFKMESTRQIEVSDSENNVLITSQYSDMPRYYMINEKKYDIDDPNDIKKIPLFKKHFLINNIEYGMDSVLLEHGIQAYDKNIKVHQAAITKSNEFRYSGIIFKSQREIERDKERNKRYEEIENEKTKRKKQCDSFSIKDMYQFSDIPFEWQWVMELSHTKGIAWFMLNMNNQYVALQYINQINELIIDARSYIDGIEEFEMCTEEIDFDYPIPMYKDSIANTYVECIPYTKTGKISKYPVILHFSSSELVTLDNGYKYQNHPYLGEIKIMQDGNIGMANISFGYTKFSIRLFGLNLIIKRIDTIDGNLFKYENLTLD